MTCAAVQMVELSMPLHTLIELEPRPDGTMVERRYKINIDSTSDEDVRVKSITQMVADASVISSLPVCVHHILRLRINLST